MYSIRCTWSEHYYLAFSYSTRLLVCHVPDSWSELSEAARKKKKKRKLNHLMSLERDLKRSQGNLKLSILTAWKIIYEWRTFQITTIIPRSGCLQKCSLKGVSKIPKMLSGDQQQAVPLERQHNFNFYVSCAKRKLFSLKETWRPDWCLPEEVEKNRTLE